MNSFGMKLKFSTFGESHGKAIGCIVDGVPAGLDIDEEFIQQELNRRKPGKNQFATPRKESDFVQILSGVFEGKSTGTPISLVIFNENQKSKDYSNIKDIFRPAHADFTYFHKYGIRDYRGGGRSSARETAARVAAGAIAKLMIAQLGIILQSGIYEIDGIKCENINFEESINSTIFTLDKNKENKQKQRDTQKLKNLSSKEVYETLAVEDIKLAAKTLLPLYENKEDGFISIEVNPLLCDDASGTIKEGRELFKKIGYPNAKRRTIPNRKNPKKTPLHNLNPSHFHTSRYSRLWKNSQKSLSQFQLPRGGSSGGRSRSKCQEYSF